MQMEEDSNFESCAKEYYSSDEIDSETENFLYSQVHHKAPSESSQPENAAEENVLNSENSVEQGEGLSEDAHSASLKNSKNSRAQALGRYYVGTNCRLCGFPGHVARRCYMSVPVCHLCGVRGHIRVSCPEDLCFNCYEAGHQAKACRQQKRRLGARCTRCRCIGHQYEHCSEVWRQYHATTKNEKIVRPSSTRKRPRRTFYCFNCGKRGHLGHDCRHPLATMFLRPVPPFVVVYDKTLSNGSGVDANHSSDLSRRDHTQPEKSEDIPRHSRSKDKVDPSRPCVNGDHRNSDNDRYTTSYSRDEIRRERHLSGRKAHLNRASESTISRGQVLVNQNPNESSCGIRSEETINSKLVKVGQQVARGAKSKKETVTISTVKNAALPVESGENSLRKGNRVSLETDSNHRKQPWEREAASLTPSASCNGCAPKGKKPEGRKVKKKQKKKACGRSRGIDLDEGGDDTPSAKALEQTVNKRLREESEEDLRSLITKRKRRKVVTKGIEKTGVNSSNPDVIDLTASPVEGAAESEMTLPKETGRLKGRASQGGNRDKVTLQVGRWLTAQEISKRRREKEASKAVEHQDVICIDSSGSDMSDVIQIREEPSRRIRMPVNSNDANHDFPVGSCLDRAHSESKDLSTEGSTEETASGKVCRTREHDLTRYDPSYAFLAPPYSSLVRKSLTNKPRQSMNIGSYNNFVRKRKQRKLQASGRRKQNMWQKQARKKRRDGG